MIFTKQDGNIFAECACKYCGGVYAGIHPGKGPHKAELRCKECGRHNRWMGQGAYDLYECFVSVSPIDVLMGKISDAQNALDEAQKDGDWIALKVAQKRLDTLRDAFNSMQGHESFTGTGQ